MTLTALNIYGLCSNLIGLFILAISLGFYISSLRSAIDRLEMYVKVCMTLEAGQTIHTTVKNLHFPNTKKWSVYLSWLGVVFIAIGFTIQLFVFLFLT